ncbi:uncharacterized protein FTJAE_2384 [Fusarium tjaetaba]|uniref:Uncharacterized protein n=1 Tax=Fusarium tjaetaba TaxID=1567544 RepID=A0A8H5S4V7_9HYPO|nr:uncharacterized protein FTJAE_2384 [Fusarium tjaetaba]KAF5645954.1 hypothetical protein FTJAE_2384 [Fusarium tjaetaba]
MKVSYLLPFIGLAQAVPAPNPSYPSIFDNPTIPVGAPASFKDLPALSHVRRAAMPQTFLNVSFCDVTVTGDPGFYTSWKAQTTKGRLYITEGIPTPGTKNGDNPYDVYLSSGSLAGGGGIQFTTNKCLLTLPNRIDTSKVDYAQVRIASDGNTVATVDYSNLVTPRTESPVQFTTEPNIGTVNNWVYGPPTRRLAFAPSYISIKVGDKGIVSGGVLLTSNPYGSGSIDYFARITGVCGNMRMPIVA